MHRTQILLQPTQYRQLKSRATKAHVSLGELIRSLVDRYLRGEGQTASLKDYCGILDDKECQSTNVKKFLYPDV